MSTRGTVRTIERGIRISQKSHSTNSLAISQPRSTSPIEHVRQQLNAFVNHSHDEKNEMSKLNDRMGAYVKRVKMLENENSKLLLEINDRQAAWGDETRRVREQLEPTLYDMRGRIDKVANAKTIADVRNKRAQFENIEYQRKCDDNARAQNGDRNKIATLEHELNQLKETKLIMNRSLEDAKMDLQKQRLNRDQTWENLVQLLDKLDDEVYRRVDVEYSNQTLREHIEFVKQVNEKEIAEMNQLEHILPFNDQVEFYKDQLKRVISNIRSDYENLNLEQQREMEEWLKVKTDELEAKAREQEPLHELEMNIQIENLEQLKETYDQNNKELEDLKLNYNSMTKRLYDLENHIENSRSNLNETLEKQEIEIRNLNEDMKVLMDDYNHINCHKANLEYEMHVYKRLLDSQIERFDAKQPEVPTKSEKNQTIISSNQVGGKVQNKKEKKGSVGICDASPDGKYVVIENSGSNNISVDLSGWAVRRKIDTEEVVYRIPQGVILNPNKQMTIWAGSNREHKNSNDLNADFESWGIGIKSNTRLINQNGEEKSSFYQIISFSF